jgi:glyoxylase-like metal-dependent hydrolase (beta-lactamase superfamily II)
VSNRYAWTSSGVEQVATDVFRIPLPLPNDGLRAVNVYAVRGPNGIGLVDGGWHRPAAFEALRQGLAEIGATPDDIQAILATHFHRDHYTLAVELQRTVGCRVGLGAGERATVDAIMAGQRASDSYGSAIRRAGVPAEANWPASEPEDVSKQYQHPSWWIDDGDQLPLGGRVVEALATPGHTRGHLCFADDTNGLLFAGDHVLPHITPSIGLETVPSHLPLADYLDSLRRVRARPDATLLPAHGPAAPSVHARVDELLAHHDDRLRRCGDAVAAGAETGYQVTAALAWTRRGRSLDELIPFDQMLAVRETMAHLDVLVLQKRLTCTESGGVATFRVS